MPKSRRKRNRPIRPELSTRSQGAVLTPPGDSEHRRDLTSRSMPVRADSIDEEARSIEAVMSTENPVAVFDWNRWDIIDEVLLARGAELPDQVVLLENHRRWELDDVLGSVRNMRTTPPETIGRLFFDTDERAERAWGKVKRRHVRDVSVGYRALEFVDIEPGRQKTIDGKTYKARKRVLRITKRWALRELSLTPIGADEDAKTRHNSTLPGVNPMNERLRAYLESIGLRAEATDEQAQSFRELLSGQRAEIAAALETETDETRDAVAATLRALGVDPADPSKPLDPLPPAELGRAAPPIELAATDPPVDPPTDPATARVEGAREERARVAAINGMSARVSPELVNRAISEGWTEARASSAFLQNVQNESRQPTVGAGPAVHGASQTNARAIAAGMLASQNIDPTTQSMFRGGVGPTRADQLTEQDADQGEAFRSLSTFDLVRECLHQDTGRWYRSIDEAMEAARDLPYSQRAGVSGGTLSYVFGTNVYARVIQGWENSQADLSWAVVEDVANFMQHEDIQFEASARLEELPRGDTAKDATVSDSRELYQIARFAKKWTMDEQDVIDDRFSVLMDMAGELGDAAAMTPADLLYSLLLRNPTLADTGALFNATAVTTTGGHANLGTDVLASAGMTAALLAMGTQRDSNSNPLNITPTHLLTCPDLKWTANELVKHQTLIKLFADSSDPLYSTINQLAQEGIKPVADARLNATGCWDPTSKTTRAGSATNWFLIKKDRKSIRLLFRRGTGRRPKVRRFNLEQGQWGLGWDIDLDIGAAAGGWRGCYKSTGAG